MEFVKVNGRLVPVDHSSVVAAPEVEAAPVKPVKAAPKPAKRAKRKGKETAMVEAAEVERAEL
tara:strand:- start:100 stop:288 length:189 start_codon:yes stop_codon:yes gene_type:complete